MLTITTTRKGDFIHVNKTGRHARRRAIRDEHVIAAGFERGRPPLRRLAVLDAGMARRNLRDGRRLGVVGVWHGKTLAPAAFEFIQHQDDPRLGFSVSRGFGGNFLI